MATEVELFEYRDIAGRPGIRGYIDSAGDAQLALGEYTAARFITINGIQYLVGGSTVLDVTETQALVAGTGKQVAPLFLSAYGGVVFDAGAAGTMPTMGVVINAATDVIAAQQIDDAGAQAHFTTISGLSTTGEVMLLSAGSVNITSVHIGFSTGTAMVLSADTTILIGEMVRFDFDAADLVQSVRVNFSPPRGSGRYIDVSCIGQQRAA